MFTLNFELRSTDPSKICQLGVHNNFPHLCERDRRLFTSPGLLVYPYLFLPWLLLLLTTWGLLMVGIGLDVVLVLVLHPLEPAIAASTIDVLIKKDNTDTYNKSKTLYYSE